MENISKLLFKYLRGTLTQDEYKTLMDWVNNSPDNRHLLDQLSDESRLTADLEAWFSIPRKTLEDDNRLDAEVSRHERQTKVLRLRRWLPYVAAALLVGFFVGFYAIRYTGSVNSGVSTSTNTPANVLPGSDRAVLTLDDGSELTLGGTGNGTIADQNGVKVIQLDSGRISYRDEGAFDKITYNTITTPRGGKYQVVLPDGSKVLLNASSSLRFPTRFISPAREVSLTGQGYFEVVANETAPFVVKTGAIEVVALGTQFDIMAYPEEKEVNTTLVHGSVRVAEESTAVLLKPGQQASRIKAEKLLVREVNLDEAVAWTNGLFHFGGVSVAYIMRQIQRWYDVDIEYQSDVSSVQLSGFISRKKDLKELLDVLEDAGDVKFKLEGRKLIVVKAKP